MAKLADALKQTVPSGWELLRVEVNESGPYHRAFYRSVGTRKHLGCAVVHSIATREPEDVDVSQVRSGVERCLQWHETNYELELSR